MIALVLSSAWAVIPEGVRPAAAPSDVVQKYAEAFPDASPLACDPLLPEHVLLCFRVWEGKSRRWVTEADLTTWKADRAALRAHVVAAATPMLENEPHAADIVDMDAQYWTLLDGDGMAVGPILAPERWIDRLGGEGVRVAQPRTGVFLAWKSQSPEVDQVMAVAVHEMYDAADDAVSPMVHAWKGGTFVPFGQAKPQGR